jgi:hypothetical protein
MENLGVCKIRINIYGKDENYHVEGKLMAEHYQRNSGIVRVNESS